MQQEGEKVLVGGIEEMHWKTWCITGSRGVYTCGENMTGGLWNRCLQSVGQQWFRVHKGQRTRCSGVGLQSRSAMLESVMSD